MISYRLFNLFIYRVSVTSILKSLKLEDILAAELDRINEQKIQKLKHANKSREDRGPVSTQQMGGGISQEINQVLQDIRKTKDKHIYDAMNKHQTLTNKQSKRKTKTLDDMFEKKKLPDDEDENVEHNVEIVGNNTGNVKRKKEQLGNANSNPFKIDDESDDESIVKRLVKKKRRKIIIESDEEVENEDSNTDSLNQLVKLLETRGTSESQTRTRSESKEKTNDESDDENILSRILSARNKVRVEAVIECKDQPSSASQRSLFEVDMNDDDLGDVDEFLSGVVKKNKSNDKIIKDKSLSKNTLGSESGFIEKRNVQASQASQRSLFEVDFNDDLGDADEFLSGVIAKHSQSMNRINDSSNCSKIVKDISTRKNALHDKSSDLKLNAKLDDRLKNKIDSLKRSFERKTGHEKISLTTEDHNDRAIKNNCGSNTERNDRVTNKTDEPSEKSSYFSDIGDKKSFDRNKLSNALFKITNLTKTTTLGKSKNDITTDNTVPSADKSIKISQECTFKTPLKANATSGETTVKTPSNSNVNNDKTPLKSPNVLSKRTMSKLKMFSFAKTSQDEMTTNSSIKSPNNENSAREFNTSSGVRSSGSTSIHKDGDHFITNNAHDRYNEVNVKTNENNTLMEVDSSNPDLNNKSLDMFSSSGNTESMSSGCVRNNGENSVPSKTTNLLDDLNESDFEF